MSSRERKEYDEFLQELEEDPELRRNVHLFAADPQQAVSGAQRVVPLTGAMRALQKKRASAAAAAAAASAAAEAASAEEEPAAAASSAEPDLTDTESEMGDGAPAEIGADELIVESVGDEGLEVPASLPALASSSTAAAAAAATPAAGPSSSTVVAAAAAAASVSAASAAAPASSNPSGPAFAAAAASKPSKSK